MSLADARQRALELRRALDDGIDPRRSRPSRRQQPAPLPLSSDLAADDKHSFDYLVSEFSRIYLSQRRRPEDAEWLLGRDALPAWKGRDARSISSMEVIALLNGIVERGARVLANRTGSLLNLLFKFAVQQQIVPANPVQLLMPPGGKERPRSRVLSAAELIAFITDPHACTKEPRLAHSLAATDRAAPRRAGEGRLA